MAAKGGHQSQRETWATYYASPEIVARFEGVVDALKTEAEVAATPDKVPEITGQVLAKLTHNIQIAQENVYGREGSESGKGVKLPAEVFAVPDSGVSEQSALYTALSAGVEYATAHGMEADAGQATSGAAARELVEAVRTKLADQRQLPSIRVFISSGVGSDGRTALAATVEALGGSVVETEQEATHVVDDSTARSGTDEEWFRTLEQRDGRVLVHWWYTPDSYDAWMAAEAPYTAEAEAAEHEGVWRVSRQWVEDSAQFHEWLNAEDYETGEPKRRAYADGERLRADGESESLREGVHAQRTQEGPGRRRAEMEPVANGDVANVDTDAQLQREENARRLLVEQTQEIVVPSYAAWFKLGEVHENERRALPEFFNGRNMSKTPTVYMEYRNFMVNSYRLNPAEYLTVTACRRNLAGDVCAIMRVHAFLEQWGLINYQADADSKPSAIGPPFTGHFRVSADTPRGLVPFQPSVTAPQMAAPRQQRPPPPPSPDRLATRNDVYDSPSASARPAAEPDTTTRDVFCHTCGVNCTPAYYHCVKALRQRIDLCAPCYADGRFPGSLSSADFIKITDTAAQPNDDWSDQETLLLLEAIEMYDDDWNRIAEHVGTRDREECVLHFLKLPIVDPYEVAPLRTDPAAQSAVVPFSRADNPVMSVVAFLAANVNPGVAAAAAKAALAELTKPKEAPSENEAAEHKEGSPEKEAPKEGSENLTKDEAKMEVDDDAADKPASADNPASRQQSPDGTKPAEAGVSAAERSELPPESELAYASSVALGAAAAKAARLAQYEERQLESMVHRAVELQMSKLELKMRQFEEMEAALEQERKDLARQRQQLVEECWALKKKMNLFESGAAGRAATANGTSTFKANDNTQVTRPPTAQPKPSASDTAAAVSNEVASAVPVASTAAAAAAVAAAAAAAAATSSTESPAVAGEPSDSGAMDIDDSSQA
ncbi:SWI/SNF and RSC complex subunit Ssr2 [Coemansia sp. RSA 989]|nr:SWI/SNF and RSC complex subunit Ssr2 [Coemansia sp. RSA 989]